jgi:hypothetical protein
MLVGEKIGVHTFHGAAYVNAADFSGGDLGQQITAAQAALPPFGGTIDIQGMSGDQFISHDLFLGTLEKPVKLLLGPGQLITLNNATISIGSGSFIEGSGNGRDIDSVSTIRRLAGNKIMVLAEGTPSAHVRNFGLRRVYFDGGRTDGHGLVFHYCDTFYLDQVHVRNGGNSSALRLLDDVWDFWFIHSSFVDWGNAGQAAIALLGRGESGSGSGTVTDGHWYANQIGDLVGAGSGSPHLVADPSVTQQRFIDNKFHFTGSGQPFIVSYGGYRTAFIGNSFQAAPASTSFMLRVTSADNVIIGNIFTDCDFGDAIQVDGSGGDAVIMGNTIRSNLTPATGRGIAIGSSIWSGSVMIAGNQISHKTIGVELVGGIGTVSMGINQFTGCTTNVVITGGSIGFNPIEAGGSSISTTGDISAHQLFLDGPNTASVGHIRLPNNSSIVFRNQANTADRVGMNLDTSDNLELASNSWRITSGGFLHTGIDNIQDIGAPAANRPRHLYLGGFVSLGSTTLLALGSPANGIVIYCSDCTKATPCAGGGTGALAKRINGAWDCA